MKPQEKPKKTIQEPDREGVSREFIQRVSEELMAIRKTKPETR